jgi:hypothetical protein
MMSIWWALVFVVVLALVTVIPNYLIYRRSRQHNSSAPSSGMLHMSEEDIHKIGTYRWGEGVVRKHDGQRRILCASCQREMLANQYYWDIPLHGLAQSYYVCFSCCPDERTILDVH